MKSTARRIVRDEKGKVLILALVLLGVGGLLMAPTLGLMSTGLTAGQVYEKKTDELYAADAGVEDGINWLVHGKPHAWPWEAGDEEGIWHRSQVLEINRNNVNVTIEALESLGDHTYKITSRAGGEGSGTTVISIVKAPPRNLGCHYFTEGLTLNNQSGTISGTIIVVGNVDLHNSVTLNATEVYIDGNLHLHQKSTLKADIICLTGNITMDQSTTINADIHFLGDNSSITINQAESYVRRNIWAEGNLTIWIETGSASVEIECPDGVYAAGNVHVHLDKKNSRLVGDIYAGGAITIYKGHSQTIYNDCRYHLDEDEYWVSEDGCGPQPDPPFIIGDCPQLPDPQGTVVDTYEVLGYGG